MTIQTWRCRWMWSFPHWFVLLSTAFSGRLNAFDNSSGSSGKPENEYCGKERFYCPHDSKRYDRVLRCTSANVCVSDANSPEEKCYESETSGRYKFFKKKPVYSLIGHQSIIGLSSTVVLCTSSAVEANRNLTLMIPKLQVRTRSRKGNESGI